MFPIGSLLASASSSTIRMSCMLLAAGAESMTADPAHVLSSCEPVQMHCDQHSRASKEQSTQRSQVPHRNSCTAEQLVSPVQCMGIPDASNCRGCKPS